MGDLVRNRPEQEPLCAGHAEVADDDQIRALLLGDVEDRVGRVALPGERLDLLEAHGAGLRLRRREQGQDVLTGIDDPLQVRRHVDVRVAQALARDGLVGADDLQPSAQRAGEVDRVTDGRGGGVRSICSYDDRREHEAEAAQASLVIAITIPARTNTTIAT